MIRRTRTALGTFVEISALGKEAEAAVEEAFKTIQAIEDKTSFYLPSSDVSRINTLDTDTSIEIDTHTFTILSHALKLSALSKGLFDITVAPTLVKEKFLPPSFIKDKSSSSWQDIRLDEQNCLCLRQPVCIDLGGIAKGYAVDKAIESMRTFDIYSGCVNAGGDLRVVGEEKTPLLIRHPIRPSETVSVQTFLLNNAAATSAGYYADTKSGQLPIVNPHTGNCIQDQQSVTVIAPTCMTADSLTKVLMLSPENAFSLLHHYDARALILRCDENSEDTIYVFDSHPIQTDAQDKYVVV